MVSIRYGECHGCLLSWAEMEIRRVKSCLTKDICFFFRKKIVLEEVGTSLVSMQHK